MSPPTRRWSSDVCSSDLRARAPPFPEEGDLVLEERELDLQLPLAARGALREEFQQDAQAVVALDPQVTLEEMMHRRPEFSVEDDDLDIPACDPLSDFLELASPDEGARLRPVASLHDWPDAAMPRGPHLPRACLARRRCAPPAGRVAARLSRRRDAPR